MSREHAIAIWQAGVDAVKPGPLLHRAVAHWNDATHMALQSAPVIRVVGCGKATAAMATALEAELVKHLDKIVGIVNIPEGCHHRTAKIELHPARPQGYNFPTQAGVFGALQMKQLLADAGPNDVALALISGGGSALLPLPVDGVSLAEKLELTKQLSRSGADIHELNTVRKHLSAIKGGQLAASFRGAMMLSLIISDVIGDPLDIIASGPTVPDPTTFADAISVLKNYHLWDGCATSVRVHLEAGLAGERPETPKRLPPQFQSQLIGTNDTARHAASAEARRLGYHVLDLGGAIAGDTTTAALAHLQSASNYFGPRPACMISGGETTVNLGNEMGRGGRNTEFVLACMEHLPHSLLQSITILSGGTDGEDGPTDAAGAVADASTLQEAIAHNVDAKNFLRRHDSYTYFNAVGGLLRTGLTETNVMDLRVTILR